MIKKEEKIFWHNLSPSQALDKLDSSLSGLSWREAEKRQKKYGLNKLPEKPPVTAFSVFLRQFLNPLIPVLIIALAISAFLREYIDFLVIALAILVNTVIGFIQEYKADRALEALKKIIRRKAFVIRDGGETEIDAELVVPGDIVVLEEGFYVPADLRLIEAHNLQVSEAFLTGESMPSEKKISVLPENTIVSDRENMVFMGSIVLRGRGKGIVVVTGMRAQIGKIVKSLKEVEEEATPLQQKLDRFGLWLSLFFVMVTIAIMVIGLLSGKPLYEMLLIAVAVAVAAIPEGLMLAVTVAMTIGMRNILISNGLIRRLVAAETLGGVTVICADKTGTMTEGRLSVSHIITPTEEFDKEKINDVGFEKDPGHLLVLKIGLLCNNAVIENPKDELRDWILLGDPLDQALIMAATGAGLEKSRQEEKFPRIDEIPFEAEKKFMATLHGGDKENFIFVKGAPEVIIGKSRFFESDQKILNFDERDRQKTIKDYESLAGRGLRVIAFGYKKVDSQVRISDGDISDLIFVGLVGFKDPLRPEVKELIVQSLRAGIRTIMITGDHRLTALAIAQEAGINIKDEKIEVMEGLELDEIDLLELEKRIRKIKVFARTLPVQKLKIVQALQDLGEVVAMTGDGVNDALAIKKADIGIALGSATDVAKETSDLVLLDNRFQTIVLAIRQGRAILSNIRKIITYLLANSFTEMILIGGSLMLGLPLPVLPAQILWVNLIGDGPPNFALAFEPPEPGVMRDPPVSKKAPILDREMKYIIFAIGIMTDLILFALFWYLLKAGVQMAELRTFIFAALAICSLLFVFSCRSLKYSIFEKRFFENKYLILSVLAGLLLLVGAIYLAPLQALLRTVPLTLGEWGLALGFGMLNVFLIEIVKLAFRLKNRQKSNVN